MKKNTPKLRFPEFTGNWERKKLGDIFSITVGGDIDKSIVKKYADSEYQYPVYANTLINNGLYGYTKLYKIDSETITVTGRGEVGHAVPRYTPYYPIVRLIVLTPKLLLSIKFYSEVINMTKLHVESTGVPQLTAPQLVQVKIAWTVYKEQNKIADFLSAMDKSIDILKRKKELLDKYKKGVMQKIFSREIRFKDDNGNDYPDWEEKKLGEVVVLITKGTTPSKFKNFGVRYVKIESLINNEINNSMCNYIDDSTHSTELKRSILKENDILFAIAGSLGKSCIVKKENLPANTNQALSIIRLKNSINYAYILYLLNSFIMDDYIKKNLSVGAQPNLNLEQVHNFQFPLPSLPEQKKIADFLSSIDNKIDIVSKQIKNTELYKKSLLQQMFV